jgi:hypothetical protein
VLATLSWRHAVVRATPSCRHADEGRHPRLLLRAPKAIAAPKGKPWIPAFVGMTAITASFTSG